MIKNKAPRRHYFKGLTEWGKDAKPGGFSKKLYVRGRQKSREQKGAVAGAPLETAGTGE